MATLKKMNFICPLKGQTCFQDSLMFVSELFKHGHFLKNDIFWQQPQIVNEFAKF